MPYVLTVNFTLSSPDAGNYRIKYWPQNNPSNITTDFTTSSPYVMTYLAECSYAGTIESACAGGLYSAPQSFSVSNCPNEPVSFTPCALVSSNGLTPSQIYLGAGVTDIATGVQLYDSNGGVITTVTLIADSTGVIYNVNSSGVVGTPNGQSC